LLGGPQKKKNLEDKVILGMKKFEKYCAIVTTASMPQCQLKDPKACTW